MVTKPRTLMANLGLGVALLALALSIVPFVGIFGMFPGVIGLGLGLGARVIAEGQEGAGKGRGTAAAWIGGLATLLAITQSG